MKIGITNEERYNTTGKSENLFKTALIITKVHRNAERKDSRLHILHVYT